VSAGRAREEMVRHILGMLDDFLHAFPLLSFVRGEAFTPDHWASLFRTLEFDTSKVRSGNALFPVFCHAGIPLVVVVPFDNRNSRIFAKTGSGHRRRSKLQTNSKTTRFVFCFCCRRRARSASRWSRSRSATS